MDREEYKRKALESIVSYIESVMASYSKEELEARIKEALPKKESEDERIRKWLSDILDESNWRKDWPYTKQQVINYLEKQKEHKPVILGPDETEFPYNHPANTLEGEIKNIWSKLSSKNAFVASFEGFREVILHFVNFVQKVQKPAEWSEDDAIRLEDVITLVEHHHDKEYNWFDYDDLATWLKSLRPQPHWKPSEDQMIALEYFIRSWGESGTMSPQNPTLCAAKSLYNDLQKLL